ncbi:MAG: exopolysaccharide biosynthesis polyprenyl glycosylphosphotransferase [Anaerolineales bacterium]
MKTNTQLSVRNYDESRLLLLGKVKEGRSVYYATKRLIDFTLSLALLILFAPLMLLIAGVIYLDSPGPIFFSQERVGAKRYKQGKEWYWIKTQFRCYKFRTMIPNADTKVHQQYVKALIENNKEQMDALQGELTESRKLVNDSRLIRSGKLLRKFSLDELPQLWNVLVGDMSMVGPRPAIPYEVELYSQWHLRRLEAQPGITGLQQITARSTEFDRQVQLDIEYIENQSWWLDTLIALKTPFAVISGKGAY